MHKIFDLREMDIERLHALAGELGIKGFKKMDKDALDKAGVNDSLVHVDFMIGTKDLSIDGQTADGEWVAVFRNGNFVE